MQISTSDILWLLGSALLLAGTFAYRRSGNDRRANLLQAAGQVVMMVSLVMTGRATAAAGRATGAAILFVAAAVMGVATIVLIAKWVRAR